MKGNNVMKFIATKKAILVGLKEVSQATSARSYCPACACVKLEAKTADTLEFAANNLDVSIQNQIAGETLEYGTGICVNAKSLATAVKEFPGAMMDKIVLEGDGTYNNGEKLV